MNEFQKAQRTLNKSINTKLMNRAELKAFRLKECKEELTGVMELAENSTLNFELMERLDNAFEEYFRALKLKLMNPINEVK